MPPLDELLTRAHVVALPLAARFRGVTVREAMLFDGPVAWSEWSPFSEYDDAEATTWLAAALEFGFDPSLARLADGAVAVNATVPAVPAADVAGVLARYDGCRTAKVKVAERGQSLADDLARVAEVRRIMGPDARLRVDSNAGWGVPEAVDALTALAEFELEYAEQPVPGIGALAEVRRVLRARGVPVRVAADEAVRKATDPLAVARAGAADVIIVKAQPLGGVRRAAAVARAAGLPATVSSALDTSVGIAMGAQLAAAVAGFSEEFGAPAGGFDAGLGTASLFTDDVTAPPLRPRGGRIPLAPVSPDRDALARLAAPPERDGWWRERLRRCHALLSATA
ncbi:o-succinylbenzoate synthase [Pseudoclavibacter endophyticus]|uniref:o-succinylbenzoate synthase n=1 Tax=Pseudoclavibacter endophyticus TaxID=1778590 RepID=A0A6H9WUS8_9MICO|nr:o-succinylbenzoate synthase [Pseudoclavibacter endophyticus]KAB1650445.1 o-succinylbenzoate synthase [Pseudoclavibacter endophyticus]GGA66902.1 o-succinylbenzoate synthase [Pseudoclavibacter endophyticus]